MPGFSEHWLYVFDHFDKSSGISPPCLNDDYLKKLICGDSMYFDNSSRLKVFPSACFRHVLYNMAVCIHIKFDSVAC